MHSKRAFSLATLVAIAMAMVAVAVVQATPPSGQHPSVPTIGALDETIVVNTDRIKFQTKDPTDVATYSVTYEGGGFSGWHTHPGILLVTVQSGAVVRSVGCSSWTYAAGQTFIESDEQAIGAIANASATDQAVLLVTQITPRGSARRVDAASAPAC
jgi:quercetin dioxygenase-like cupin family protein